MSGHRVLEIGLAKSEQEGDEHTAKKTEFALSNTPGDESKARSNVSELILKQGGVI